MIYYYVFAITLLVAAVVFEIYQFRQRTCRDPEVDDLIRRIKAGRNKKFNNNWRGHYEL